MKAELTSGEIVTLTKDCNCVTHNDPHWTHMDRTARTLNRRLIDPTGKTPEQQYYGYLGIAKEEQARLQQKMRDMQSRGIVRLIPEDSDEMTEIQAAQLERNRLHLLAEFDRKQPAPIKNEDELRRERNNLRDEVREKAKELI